MKSGRTLEALHRLPDFSAHHFSAKCPAAATEMQVLAER
jgi:hypothetical protein